MNIEEILHNELTEDQYNTVIDNHHVELTEEEKTEARKEAIKRAENEAYSRMTKRKTAPKKESINSNNGQMTLLF